MNTWLIRPFAQVGPLRFGASRGEIRKELGPNFKAFRKTPLSKNDTDAYAELGFHIYYDDGDGDLGYHAVRDNSGCHFPEVGISFYSPDENKIEGVGIFEKVEFDRFLNLKREANMRRELRLKRQAEEAAEKRIRNPFDSK